MNVIECALDDDSGFVECNATIKDFFQIEKFYNIVTHVPYLVVETDIPDSYAFLDTGFSGAVERSELSTHQSQSWGHDILNAAYNKDGSRIYMIGLTSMKEYSSLLIDYDDMKLGFGIAPTESKEIRQSRSFTNFESEMFSIETTLFHPRRRAKAMVFSFVDTGNPSTFIMNGALKNELSDFKIDARCDCADELDRVRVQDAVLSLRDEDIQLFVGGLRLLDTIKIVCNKDDGPCATERYNSTIRNHDIRPAVAINIGNDALSRLGFVYIDFNEHRFYTKRSNSRQFIKPLFVLPEPDRSSGVLKTTAKIFAATVLVLLLSMLIARHNHRKKMKRF